LMSEAGQLRLAVERKRASLGEPLLRAADAVADVDLDHRRVDPRGSPAKACLALRLGDHDACDLLDDDRSEAARELANGRLVGHALIDRDQTKRRRCKESETSRTSVS
jgi:hypothetical protein